MGNTSGIVVWNKDPINWECICLKMSGLLVFFILTVLRAHSSKMSFFVAPCIIMYYFPLITFHPKYAFICRLKSWIERIHSFFWVRAKVVLSCWLPCNLVTLFCRNIYFIFFMLNPYSFCLHDQLNVQQNKVSTWVVLTSSCGLHASRG